MKKITMEKVIQYRLRPETLTATEKKEIKKAIDHYNKESDKITEKYKSKI